MSPFARVAGLAACTLVAALATVASPAGGSGRSLVQHAVVSSGPVSVEVWSDAASGEVAFQIRGDGDVTIIRALTVAFVSEGHLKELATYRTQARAWRPIALQYGLTPVQTAQALAAGDTVDRPTLMEIPSPEWETSTYTRVFDFGTDVRALRRSVRYSVPAPGLRLVGLTLAAAELVRFRGPGHAVDSLPVATLVYSSDPARLGLGGDRELVLNAASPRRGWGAAYATSFLNSSDRLAGPGYDARLSNANQAILRYHDAYVGIRATWIPSRRQWRAIFALAAR